MLRFSRAPVWRYCLLICFLSTAFLLLAGCGQNATARQTSTRVGRAPSQSCDIEVDWAMHYGSLKGLKRAEGLDLAVQGTFTTMLNTQGSGPPSSDFSFVIGKVLLDPHHLLKRPFTSITIHQIGGWQGNTLHQACGDPLFQVGEKAILFLYHGSPDQYFVIGGPSGRFEDHNGIVQPVNAQGVQLPSNLTEQQFYALLQKA
ncbi:MAG: hypothetical protein H0W02_23605 [Ktedonobacteraceae bacterium]|nr:hypothetical protein [Ktedonobacteraceae bacterium]